MKKSISFLVTFLLLAGALFAPCAYGADAVTSTTATIGGKTFQLVYINTGAGVSGQIAVAYSSVAADKAAKGIIDGAATATGKKVMAAVNGGYFNAYYTAANTISYPSNCPRIYATIIQGGKLINGGGTKQAATLGFDSAGKPMIDWVSFSPKVTFRGSVTVTPWGLNNYYADSGAIMQFTDEMTLPVTCDAASKIIYIKDGAVTDITDGRTFRVGAGYDVLVYNTGAIANAETWEAFPAVGDSVSFAIEAASSSASDVSLWSSVTQAVSVGPMILQNGVSVTGTDTVSEAKQAPTAVNQKTFAAVMSDGRLLLGSGTASYNDIASYLITLGAVEAMSLDGGASSTLYTASKGFLQSAGRNLSNMIVFLSAPAQTGISAYATPSTVLVNGEERAFEAYNISGSNYFKLRDFAAAISGTEKQFEVTWDNSAKIIALLSGQTYTPAGTEFAAGDGKTKNAVLSASALLKDGETLKLTAYTINGSNYFKLRDLAKAFDIAVTWDSETATIGIDTSGSYEE